VKKVSQLVAKQRMVEVAKNLSHSSTYLLRAALTATGRVALKYAYSFFNSKGT